MIINHNMSAVNSNRVLKFREWDLDKSIEKLSSGMRINRAGDDASGLAVSEKMRTQIKGLRQAERNTEDGMSFVQTADGYLNEISDILQRIRVLAVQSANGIYTPRDREMIQFEVNNLFDEIDRISSQAEFNGYKLFARADGKSPVIRSMWFHMGPNMYQRERVTINEMTTEALGLKFAQNQGGMPKTTVSTADKANQMIGLIDEALYRVNKQRANLGAYYNRLEHAAKGLMVAYENVQAAESRIRDTDMAEEMVNFTKNQILVETNTAMLSQSNAKPRSVLTLLK